MIFFHLLSIFWFYFTLRWVLNELSFYIALSLLKYLFEIHFLIVSRLSDLLPDIFRALQRIQKE